jgi:hypothetical protein
MLELEPVTKFKKEAFSRWLKDKDRQRYANSLITNYEEGMTAEQILEEELQPRQEVY